MLAKTRRSSWLLGGAVLGFLEVILGFLKQKLPAPWSVMLAKTRRSSWLLGGRFLASWRWFLILEFLGYVGREEDEAAPAFFF